MIIKVNCVNLAILPPSSLQLVPVTRIEILQVTKGDSGDIKEKGFLRVSHGGQEIHGYGITSV